MRVWLFEWHGGPESTTAAGDQIVVCSPIARLMSLFGQTGALWHSEFGVFEFGVFEDVRREILGRVEDLRFVVRVGRRCE